MLGWDEERETKYALIAASRDEARIGEVFRGLAEYDTFEIQQRGGYAAWTAKHGVDPNDPDADALWDALHNTWMIAWDLFGWDEFQRRLAAARQLN